MPATVHATTWGFWAGLWIGGWIAGSVGLLLGTIAAYAMTVNAHERDQAFLQVWDDEFGGMKVLVGPEGGKARETTARMVVQGKVEELLAGDSDA